MSDTRNVRRALAALAAVLATLAVVVGTPRREASRALADIAAVDARQLARWIRDGRTGLRVLDLRDDSAFAAGHVPSAELIPRDRIARTVVGNGETVVLYSDQPALDAWTAAELHAAGPARVYVLRGGARAWASEVLSPIVRGDSAADVAALSRWFGGVPRIAPAGGATGDATSAGAKDARAADVYGPVARRGC